MAMVTNVECAWFKNNTHFPFGFLMNGKNPFLFLHKKHKRSRFKSGKIVVGFLHENKIKSTQGSLLWERKHFL